MSVSREQRDRLHLLHIRDAIDKIESYSKSVSLSEFRKRMVVFDAIMMQIIVIGEAVNSLSEDFKEINHDMPWQQAVSLRNRAAHGYTDMNADIVWDVIQRDLPELKRQVENIIR